MNKNILYLFIICIYIVEFFVVVDLGFFRGDRGLFNVLVFYKFFIM